MLPGALIATTRQQRSCLFQSEFDDPIELNDHTKKEMMAVSNIQKCYRPRWLYNTLPILVSLRIGSVRIRKSSAIMIRTI